MKQGDQEKNNQSLLSQKSQSHKIDKHLDRSVRVDYVDVPQDENVIEREDMTDVNAIISDNAKNVSSKPARSPKRDNSISKQYNAGANGPPSDTQHQEAVPQFSTNPDQNPPTSNMNSQMPQNSTNSNNGKQPKINNGLITQYGRQLSGNHDLDLNFKKKSKRSINDPINQQRLSFKAARMSQGGDSEKISPLEQKSGVPLQKNTTMRILKNQNNMAPFQSNGFSKFSQQRTINLNFFDDLQLGFENVDIQNLNYDGVSNSAHNQGKSDWFQDPNFSVIYKNPKGSEFLDHGDYEDEKMYESRELDTPQIMDSARNVMMPKMTMTITPPAHSSSLRGTPMFIENQHGIAGPVSNNHLNYNHSNQQNHAFIDDFHNSELDLGAIHHKSQTSKFVEEDYNTQNKDSEENDFLPKFSIIHKNQTMQADDQLLRPKSKHQNTRKRTNANMDQTKSEDQSLMERMKRKMELSIVHIDADLDNSDIYKRFNYDINEKPQLDDKRAKAMIMNQFQDYQAKGANVDNSFLMIVDKLPIERVDDFQGKCVRLRQLLCITRININHLAYAIIKSKIFEAVSLLVIVANSVTLAIEDPTDQTPKDYQDTMDTLFLALYTIEMILKIIGLGFVFNRGAYLRDAWNIMDFVIVVTAYLPLLLQGGSLNLSGLRAFRVLRPLKSISSIEGLKVIVSALLSSLPLLRDTIIVLIFFFFIFAIAGLQLFGGYLKKRCVNIETGVPHPDDDFCGYKDCDPGYFCGKRNENPNFGQTNFDTIFYSLIAIFTSVTLEGWTATMHQIDKSFTNLSFLFFIPLVFIGAFFLMNLTLAVIKSKFTKQHEERKYEKMKGNGNKKSYANEFVTYDYLDDDAKKAREERELQLRKKILNKWRMILFIKERIRMRIRMYKEKKFNDTQNNKNRTTFASTGLENGAHGNGYDYGQLFGTLQDVESQQNSSAKLELETQQSQRQLLQNRSNAQIHLAQLGDDKLVKVTNNGNKINIHTLRHLDHEAIAEEDDEYKTEFSNIIANNRHFSNKHLQSSKNVRNGSNGSKSTPKSGTQNDQSDIRRLSSRGLNFNNQIQFLNNKVQNEGILIESPGKKIKLVGMQQFKKNDKNKRREAQTILDSNILSVRSRRMSKKMSIDGQFFIDFVNNDLEMLEKNFSEEQLIDIARQVEEAENIASTSQILELIEDEDSRGHQFSDISILTDDYPQRNANIMPNLRSDEEINDDKNQTPYTQTTGQFAKSGNNYYRQRSKNTNHFFMSQDLSISYDYDDNNEQQQAENFQKINESPQTYQSISNDIINSNEVPINRQITDFSHSNNNISNQRENQRGYNATYGGRNGKKTESTATNPQNNLSHSNLTTINQNGTIQSDANPLIVNQKTRDMKESKKRTMGSAKIIPYELNSFDPKTADEIIKARHGPNTIYNQDTIPIDKSVLNSRFLISDYLHKNQKIYIKKEKFDFAFSSQDIFEQRDEILKAKILEQKRIVAISYSKNLGLKPYQKKVKYTPKLFQPNEDQTEFLLYLGLEANELLTLIQQQYNEAYITNVYVTGTLSIAIHDKKDVSTNRTRKIQNVNLKADDNDDMFNDSFNQSMTLFNAGQGTNNSINTQSPLKRYAKTTYQGSRKQNLRILSPAEQFNTDVKNELFLKSTSNPILSKSIRRIRTNVSVIHEIRKRQGAQSENNQTVIDSALKRELLLKKAAAKDPQLQRRLILSEINRDANRSEIFRIIRNKRLNRMTEDEKKANPQVVAMLKIEKNEEEDEDEEEVEEEESTSEDEIHDDFLDWPVDCKVEILKAKKNALASKKNTVQWSGQDVLTDFDPQHAISAINQVSSVRIWPKWLYGYWKKFQIPVKAFVKGPIFDNFMTASVFVNTVALALDKYGISQTDQENLTTMNTIFTWIFICELSFKLIGLGPVKYFKDKMNYLDCMVVILSIVEMTILSNSGTNLSAFRSIRIFRTFRVLRVARLLRSMQSMQVIISVLIRSMDSFIYLALLLMLFIFIYALLGMQIFGGNFDFDANFSDPPGIPRTNFNNFNAAFLTTFQILTLEGWPSLLYDALRSGVSQPITVLYFISWVFLGNFMLLNLFLAILLDSFTEETPHKNNEEEDEKTIRKKHFEELGKKEGQELIEYYQETKDEGSTDKSKKGLGNKKKKKKKKRDENMLDESFEFTKEALTKKVVTKKKKLDFEGIECDLSFYFLTKKSKFRIYLYRMVTHTGFETVILILIILSSIKLVVDTYIYDYPEDDIVQVLSANVDYFFTSVFAMESVFKSLAFGFIQDKGSYLRETWSQLDFFIVCTSLIDASFESVNLPIIKILRLLRTLRPLRFISHNSGMKTIVVALLGSVSGIFNVLIVVVVVWMMFGILAVNFFGGKMQYCSELPYVFHSKIECLKNRGQWKTQDYNFDNVPQAMITLFALATLENWPDIMYNTINSVGIEIGPQINASPLNGYFFVVYILIGSFLFLNLFVGVIFKEFQDAQEEEKASLMLKEQQAKWVDIMKMIVNSNPDLETTNKPKQAWRAQIHAIMTGTGFKYNYVDFFIMSCIVLNMFQMAINFEGSSLRYNNILDYINYFFTGVFALECMLKLLAYGRSYFKTSWNIFDFCVVSASFFDIVMNQMSTNSLKFLRVGPQLARVMRVMRVSRLFRLINKYKGLQALIQTITFSLPSLFNVFSLLMLVYFIFAVLGNFLFRSITKGMVVDEFTNFQNFSNSIMTMIRMSTGEDWIYIMYDCMRTEDDNCIPGQNCGINYAPVFFIPYIMITQFIMLNLFIMVIIQQFEIYYLQEDNVLERFKDDLVLFKKNWTKFTADHDCLKLKDTKLVSFFRAMDPPLGMSDKSDKDIIKNVVLMELQSDEDGFVYFHELLYRTMRRYYGELHVKNKILVDHELRAMQKIEVIKLKMKKKSLKQERNQAAKVNPFMLQIYMNISFKAWRNQYTLNKDKREQEKEYLQQHGQDNFDLLSEDTFMMNETKKSEQVQQEWEYKTDYEIDASDEDDNSSEENSQNSQDEDDDGDSSRMLRQRPVDVVYIKANQKKLQGILKNSRNPSRDHSKSKINTSDSKEQYQLNKTPETILIRKDEPPKRLSTRNNNLTVEVPKKRISNSQQPPSNRQTNESHCNSRPSVNNDPQEQIIIPTTQQQFKFDLDKINVQSNQQIKSPQPFKIKEQPVIPEINTKLIANSHTAGQQSHRKRDNVIVSSRSGSQGDLKDDSGGEERDDNDPDAMGRSMKDDENSDQIVLLKINMNSNLNGQQQNNNILQGNGSLQNQKHK